MRKIIALLIMSISGVALAQNPEIKTDLPTIVPPSPTVAALMKFEEVPVSNYTGIPDISIPLYSVGTRSKDINLNLSLSYHPSSIAANERASDVGLGWSLFAGGTVSRTIRGLADEFYQSGNTTNKVGIYHNTEPAHHNGYYEYLDLLDNGASTSAQQYLQQEFAWESNEKGKYDTEHDLWQYNFMGFSGRFYIKKNSSTGFLEVVKMDDSTVKIVNTYDTSATASKYTPISFTIYDDKGNRYEFDVVEVTNQNTFTQMYGNYLVVDPSLYYVDPYYPKTSASPTTTYKSAFHLSRVYDNNDQLVIDFSYNNEDSLYKEYAIDETTKESKLTNYDEEILTQQIAERSMLGHCPDGMQDVGKIEPKLLITKSNRNTTVKKLKTINVYGKARIDFDFTVGRQDENLHNPGNSYVFKQMIVKTWNYDSIKKINLNHHYSKIIDKRLMLSNVVISNFENTKTEVYHLFYKPNTNTTQTVSKDYWGYFNLIPVGFMGGHYREVNPTFCKTDVLQKMTLPIGGCVILDFEANSYSYEGATALTNFDDNPNNWDHTTETHNFVSTNTTVQNLRFSATNNQKVTFYPDTNSLGEEGGVSLVKDGVVISSYTSLNCPSEIPNCGIEFTLDANSQYGLKIWSISSNTQTASVDVVYHDRKAIIENCLYGGGVRIKRLGYFSDGSTPQNYYEQEPNSQPDKEKIFDYNFIGQSKSSGSLSFIKPLFSYSTELNPGIHCSTISSLILNYDVITDFNNLSPVKTKGADIGYKEVTVSETGNGRTEFTYTSPIDFPESDFSFTDRPPFRASENFDYKRGLLLKEKVLHNDGRVLSESISTINDYVFENHLEVTGIKFYYHPINCPESFRYVDYDQFKYCTVNAPTCNMLLGNINCGNDAADFIGNEKVKEAFGWAKLKLKTTKNYFYPNGSSTPNIVQTTETYDYNPLNKKISKSTVTNSLGEVLETRYFYHTGNSSYSQNRISEIERIESYRGTELLSKSQINYANNWSGNASYLPQSIVTAKGTAGLENRLIYELYDEYSNPLQFKQEGGTVVSYIWGYNKTQPIAKIENATYAQVSSYVSNIQTLSNGTNEAGLISALNALRTALPNAMISTYTYIPLVGVHTITDPKGDKVTYEYDEFNRLKAVYDKDGYKLAENDYHYRTQN